MSAEKHQQRIEAYLAGTLSAEERTDFKNDLKSDPTLRREYRLYLLTEKAIDQALEDQLRGELNEIRARHQATVVEMPQVAEPTVAEQAPAEEIPTGRVVPLWRRGWVRALAAACVVLLIGWTIYEIIPATGQKPAPVSKGPVASALIELPSENLSLSDVDQEEAFKQAKELFFVDKDYPSAAEQLAILSNTESAYRSEAEILLAYSKFKAEDYEAAAGIFQSYLDQPEKIEQLPPQYQDPDKIRWDLILSRLGQGDLEAVRKGIADFPPDADPFYLKQAKELQQQLTD